jgi:hypothetical protein
MDGPRWFAIAFASLKKKNILGHTRRFVQIFYRDAKNKKNIVGDLQIIAAAVHPFYFEH